MNLKPFLIIPCLTEESPTLDGLDIRKKWFKNSDSRNISSYLQKFVVNNARLLNFLGVNPILNNTDQNINISFRSSEFIGSVPLIAPHNGKQMGDFVVIPRYLSNDKSEYIQVLSLLGNQLDLELTQSIPLASSINLRPPIYYEAIKFINLLESLTKIRWQKFKNVQETNTSPNGQINWNKYINDSYKIENLQRYPIRKNILDEFHKEYAEIRYVYDICKQEINSNNTPIQIKLSSKKSIEILDKNLYFHVPQKTSQITLRKSDNQLVKAIKTQANKILSSQININNAWRLDFSKLFEKYVQYIFSKIAAEIGGSFLNNYKFQRDKRPHLTWDLNYLEPDGIIQKSTYTVAIDAKYKSHLYNRQSNSDLLKKDFRSDLHQIIAYSAFNTKDLKYGFLCYPSNIVSVDATTYANNLNDTKVKIWILGLPLTVTAIKDIKYRIIDLFKEIEILEFNRLPNPPSL